MHLGSFWDIYNMPVNIRKWYHKKLEEQFNKQQESQDKQKGVDFTDHKEAMKKMAQESTYISKNKAAKK